MSSELSQWICRKLLFGCLLSVCLAIPAGAVELGEKVGPLELTTLDGPSFVMDNYDMDGRIGTVIAFLSARCPVTDQMAERINYVQEEYRHDDILWVGIGANPAESGEELREFCQRRGMIFPVYLDPQQKIRKRFGPKVTPEVFLLDSESVVVYHGAIGKMEDSALEAAIKALQDEKEIKVKHIPAKGTPIDKPGPKREIDDPYGSIAFSSELLFEKIEEASAHHCSTLTEAPNGDLLCLWYGGSYEASDDQKLFMARRKKGHRTWEKPEAIAGNSIKPAGNAIIFTDGSGRIWVLWGRKEGDRPRRRGSGGTGRLLYRISADNGYSWSKDQEFGVEFGVKPGWGVRNVPTWLSTGEMVLPLSGLKDHGDDLKSLYIMKTKNNGKTWQTSSPYRGGSQPTVIERDDSSLFVMMRGKPIIKQTLSEDGGKSWSEAGLSVLPNPNAGIAMTKLKNGHVVLVFNNTNEGRSPLNIARSLDGGRTWEEPLVLEPNPGEYSYPCVIQTSDGRIHISYTFRRYTIKHVEMNENWLVHLKRPN
ncbi:MAG: exo-alpha-sialidase [Planctomycetota bacterium]|jgi:predicted neuraminidase